MVAAVLEQSLLCVAVLHELSDLLLYVLLTVAVKLWLDSLTVQVLSAILQSQPVVVVIGVLLLLLCRSTVEFFHLTAILSLKLNIEST